MKGRNTFITATLTLLGLLCSANEIQVRETHGPIVIPMVFEATMAMQLTPGEEVWMEIEYRATPGSEPIFSEPGEKLWWIADVPILVLGATGYDLPQEVLSRKSVWIDCFVDGDRLGSKPIQIKPRMDGIRVTNDATTMKSLLRKALAGVDGPYIAQVAHFLAGNMVTLDVTGTSYSLDNYGLVIDSDGSIFGASLTCTSETGVIGVSSETDGVTAVHGLGSPGIKGESYDTNGKGVIGVGGDLVGPCWGVEGVTYSTYGAGVYGCANFGTTCGVDGESGSPDGFAVRATNTALTGLAYGVHAESSSSGARAVFGLASSGQGTTSGVYGRAASPDGRAVVGSATGGGYGGYFDGDVHVIGDITATGTIGGAAMKAQFDHPLDPGGKYLNHAQVLSHESMNLYSGNTVLDGQGRARIDLPDWFEKFNGNIRYHLTCIGGAASVYVSKKLENGSFDIAGGLPGLEVSWMVSAIRNEGADQSFAAVEEKPEGERGTYLRPEQFGKSSDTGLGAVLSRLESGREEPRMHSDTH